MSLLFSEVTMHQEVCKLHLLVHYLSDLYEHKVVNVRVNPHIRLRTDDNEIDTLTILVVPLT